MYTCISWKLDWHFHVNSVLLNFRKNKTSTSNQSSTGDIKSSTRHEHFCIMLHNDKQYQVSWKLYWLTFSLQWYRLITLKPNTKYLNRNLFTSISDSVAWSTSFLSTTNGICCEQLKQYFFIKSMVHQNNSF